MTYNDLVETTPLDGVMWKGSQLAALRMELVPLYPTAADRNRLGRDLNLPCGEASEGYGSSNHLGMILHNAVQHGRLGALLATVERDHPTFVRPPWPLQRST